MTKAGNLLIVIGAVFVVAGLVARFAPGLVSWFGRLPGDLRIEGESTRIYVPITSMVIVSVLLTLVLTIVSRLRG